MASESSPLFRSSRSFTTSCHGFQGNFAIYRTPFRCTAILIRFISIPVVVIPALRTPLNRPAELVHS